MAQTWYNPFSWGREDPKIVSKKFVDPLKTAVSTPYSKYLAAEVGKGLPRYTEGPLTYEMGGMEESRYTEFMSMDPGEWFKKAIGDPATKEFKEEMMPLITEGYAGALRGSGRFREEEAGIGKFTEFLATERYKAERDIPMQQIEMAERYKKMKDIDYQAKYQDWMKSLPQYNPALEQSLKFLQSPTGIDYVTYLDPGREGWFKDLLEIAGDVAVGIATGGASVPMTTAKYLAKYPATYM